MNQFSDSTADKVYMHALRALDSQQEIQEGRGEPTKEILHAIFQLDEPRNRLVTIRDINPAFAWVEVLWICAGGDNVKYLEFWNKRMWDFADPNTGLLYGAYGSRLGFQDIWDYDDMKSVENILYTPAPPTRNTGVSNENQIYRAFDALTGKPATRQCVLQIWDAETDLPLDGTAGKERAGDVPCNVLSHLLVRNGILHWLQVMRSNDAVWGWPYNIIQWTFLQEFMAGWLNVQPGPFVMLSDSFHIYQRHWANLPKIMDRGRKPPIVPLFYQSTYNQSFTDWRGTMRQLILSAYELTLCKPTFEALQDCALKPFHGKEAADIRYQPLMGMLAAESARIQGQPTVALELARKLMTSDHYWKHAWERWYLAKISGVIV